MILKTPIIITSRLLPGVQIADLTISFYGIQNGRCVFFFDFDNGRTIVERGMSEPRFGDCNVRRVLRNIVGFLAACGEGIQFERRTGSVSENGNLFDKETGEWAAKNLPEIEMILWELEEV